MSVSSTQSTASSQSGSVILRTASRKLERALSKLSLSIDESPKGGSRRGSVAVAKAQETTIEAVKCELFEKMAKENFPILDAKTVRTFNPKERNNLAVTLDSHLLTLKVPEARVTRTGSMILQEGWLQAQAQVKEKRQRILTNLETIHQRQKEIASGKLVRDIMRAKEASAKEPPRLFTLLAYDNESLLDTKLLFETIARKLTKKKRTVDEAKKLVSFCHYWMEKNWMTTLKEPAIPLMKRVVEQTKHAQDSGLKASSEGLCQFLEQIGRRVSHRLLADPGTVGFSQLLQDVKNGKNEKKAVKQITRSLLQYQLKLASQLTPIDFVKDKWPNQLSSHLRDYIAYNDTVVASLVDLIISEEDKRAQANVFSLLCKVACKAKEWGDMSTAFAMSTVVNHPAIDRRDDLLKSISSTAKKRREALKALADPGHSFGGLTHEYEICRQNGQFFIPHTTSIQRYMSKIEETMKKFLADGETFNLAKIETVLNRIETYLAPLRLPPPVKATSTTLATTDIVGTYILPFDPKKAKDPYESTGNVKK